VCSADIYRVPRAWNRVVDDEDEDDHSATLNCGCAARYSPAQVQECRRQHAMQLAAITQPPSQHGSPDPSEHETGSGSASFPASPQPVRKRGRGRPHRTSPTLPAPSASPVSSPSPPPVTTKRARSSKLMWSPTSATSSTSVTAPATTAASASGPFSPPTARQLALDVAKEAAAAAARASASQGSRPRQGTTRSPSSSQHHLAVDPFVSPPPASAAVSHMSGATAAGAGSVPVVLTPTMCCGEGSQCINLICQSECSPGTPCVLVSHVSASPTVVDDVVWCAVWRLAMRGMHLVRAASCPFQELCQNQRFQRRQWADIEPRPVRGRAHCDSVQKAQAQMRVELCRKLCLKLSRADA
jgi:hypothetical protein